MRARVVFASLSDIFLSSSVLEAAEIFRVVVIGTSDRWSIEFGAVAGEGAGFEWGFELCPHEFGSSGEEFAVAA